MMLKESLNGKIQLNKQKKCLIYPNNDWKRNWDALITLVLLLTCMITPYRMAFSEKDPDYWKVINISVDSMFAIDIVLSFLTAYYTDEYQLVDDRLKIAKNYITSWFTIDILAIIPFEDIFSS